MLSLSENKNSVKEFYSSLFELETNDCVDWPFQKTHDGYGIMRSDRPTRRVNRNICLDREGPPPENYHAAHSCGNPGCCNPKHLSWKSPQDNSDDKYAHGTMYRGEAHYRTTLKTEDVNFIRESKGTVSQRKLAKMYNISKGSIHFIQKGLTWKHL